MDREELLQVIEQARRDGVTQLDLSEQGIKELPAEIGQLTSLTNLDLSNNQLTSLPTEIGHLSSLTMLDLSENLLSSVPPEVAYLTKLTALFLIGNALSTLPPEIAHLTNLTTLSLSGNALSSFPPELACLTKLSLLSLSYNALSTLPPDLAHLTNLTWLSLSGNALGSVPPEIAHLTNLTTLHLSSNALSSLPPEIAHLTNLIHVSLGGNPLNSPPPEVVDEGTDAILAYLRERLGDCRKQWVSKLVVVGEGGVGKTSLLRALRGERFNEGESTTHGIDIRPLPIAHPHEQGVTMDLTAWDFGGQEIYHATHQFFLTNRSLFVLAWNARHGFEQGKLYYWLDTIQALAPQSPILIVATHTDERDADLPLAELQKAYPQIVGQVAISSRTGAGIDQLRTAIAEAAAKLPLMGEMWPTTWLHAAEAIRARPEKYTTPEELDRILAEHAVTGTSARVLVRWLHELGELLYFRENDELNDTVILKPQWVTEYISKVLESEEVIERNGLFTRQHMHALWAGLPRQLHDHFLRLMERFDLSYETKDNREISLVVERLPLDAPDFAPLWNAPLADSACKTMAMRFRLNTVPAGIPTWFIARSHRFTTRTHWRSGGVFAQDTTHEHLGLVRAFPHDRYLELTVRGPHPHNFFALLRDGIEVTLDRFPGLQIRRMVPCPGHDDKECSHEFD